MARYISARRTGPKPSLRGAHDAPAIAEIGDAPINDAKSVRSRFNLKIPGTLVPPFPTTIYVKAFAVTANGARGYAKLASGIDRVDTLTVVAGVTRTVPNGGTIADAAIRAMIASISPT